jgi:hypothetical protein
MRLPLRVQLLAEVLDLILQAGDKGPRLVGGRTRLVGGRTVVRLGVEQNVDGAAFPFYGECAAADAAAHRLGADTQDLGGFGHGRTPYVRSFAAVLSHEGDTRPLGPGAKAISASLS